MKLMLISTGMMVHQNCSATYFKHAVYALRYWFRLFDMEDKAIQMPPIKKETKLPVVLPRQECKELFASPVNLKHRFLPAFAYAGGLRMNELRLTKIADVDVQRMQIHIRNGKGRKQRCVGLSVFLAQKLPVYLNHVKPLKYLFEGLTPGEPMGERSIQLYHQRSVAKNKYYQGCYHAHPSPQLCHSFAGGDGVDIQTIQHLPGHADLMTTLIYLHSLSRSAKRDSTGKDKTCSQSPGYIVRLS
jgi:integrase